jgi:hypothetical protein
MDTHVDHALRTRVWWADEPLRADLGSHRKVAPHEVGLVATDRRGAPAEHRAVIAERSAELVEAVVVRTGTDHLCREGVERRRPRR